MNSIEFKLFMRAFLAFVFAIILPPPLVNAVERDSVSLAGKWSFEADHADAGLNAGWWGRKLGENLELPGVLADGRNSGTNFEGPAWYQREIEIPKDWT